MDGVRKTFDNWAENGRAELMEIEHGKNVLKFLKTIQFDKPFTFLDVGCGNGWVVRKIAAEKNCKKSIGIDKSKKIIIQSKKKIYSKKEEFLHTDIESIKYRRKFDFIFSMESLKYADSIDISLDTKYTVQNPGRKQFSGPAFYREKQSTARWAGFFKFQMHLDS